MSFSREKLPPATASGLASHQQQPLLVCTWSAHAPQSGSSRLPFLRYKHTVTTSATPAGELFLFGGDVNGWLASNDVYMFSTQDFSTTLLQTEGDIPPPRYAHSAALTRTTLVVYGETVRGIEQDRNALNYGSLYFLNAGTSDHYNNVKSETN